MIIKPTENNTVTSLAEDKEYYESCVEKLKEHWLNKNHFNNIAKKLDRWSI